jgi:hypothetical protein
VADLWDGFVVVCVEMGKKESWGKTEKKIDEEERENGNSKKINI